MAGERTEIIPAAAGLPEVELVRSARRRRTVEAQPLADGRVRVRVPATTTAAQVRDYLDQLVPRLLARQAEKDRRQRRVASDDFLLSRARTLRAQLLPQAPEPASIRWVGNQGKRWGSATPATGSIRISDLLQGAPTYVLDSVIFHELCHLVEPNHSPRFRVLEARYGQLEKARAFLEGLAFGQERQ